MKTTVQLSKETTTTALKTHLAMLTRKRNKEPNLMICEFLDKDIAELQAAINTATEGK